MSQFGGYRPLCSFKYSHQNYFLCLGDFPQILLCCFVLFQKYLTLIFLLSCSGTSLHFPTWKIEWVKEPLTRVDKGMKTFHFGARNKVKFCSPKF